MTGGCQESLAFMNESGEGIVRSIAFVGRTRGLVKRLPGFDKSRHTIPKWSGDRAQQFIGTIASSELQEWGEALFSDLREAMGYKRKDLRLTFAVGEALMESKDFVLKRRYLLDEDALSEYTVETELMELASVDLVKYSEFNDAVGPLFDRLRCAFRKEQSVEEVIDAIEEAADSGILVDYPSNCENCEARIENMDASFVFDSISVTVQLPRFCSPKELAFAVESLGSTLAKYDDLRGRVPLPF